MSQKRLFDSGSIGSRRDSFGSAVDVLNPGVVDDVVSEDSTLVCSGAVGGVDRLVARESVVVEVHHRDVDSDDELFHGRQSPRIGQMWRVADRLARSDSLSRHDSTESLTTVAAGGDVAADAWRRDVGHTPALC